MIDLKVGELHVHADARVSITPEDVPLRLNIHLLPRFSQHLVYFLFIKGAKIGNLGKELEYFSFLVDVAACVLHFEDIDQLEEVFLFEEVA